MSVKGFISNASIALSTLQEVEVLSFSLNMARHTEIRFTDLYFASAVSPKPIYRMNTFSLFSGRIYEYLQPVRRMK